MSKKYLSAVLILILIGVIGAYECWIWVTRKPLIIRYGYTPYADSAPIFVAVEQGFFAEENLNVSITKFLSGTKILQSVAVNQLDGGFGAIIPALQAFEGGIDFKFAGGVSCYDKEHDPGAYIVTMNSSIQSIADLRGKTLALATGGAIFLLPFKVAAGKYGLNITDINFITIASPLNRLEALLAGTVDVEYEAEPYLTEALSTGKVRVIYHPYTEVFPDHKFLMATSLFSKNFINQNRAAVDAFIRAYTKAIDWIKKNPDETRLIIAEWTGIDQEIVKNMTLHLYSNSIPQEELRALINLMKDYGYLESDIAVGDILYQG